MKNIPQQEHIKQKSYLEYSRTNTPGLTCMLQSRFAPSVTRAISSWVVERAESFESSNKKGKIHTHT